MTQEALHDRLLRAPLPAPDDLAALDPHADASLELLALLAVRAGSAAAACAALARLAELPAGSPALARFVAEQLAHAARHSRWATARRDALVELTRRAADPTGASPAVRAAATDCLHDVLAAEPRWPVRARAAACLPLEPLVARLEPLETHAARAAALEDDPCAALLVALDDPHWRVRNALLEHLRDTLARAPWLVDTLEHAADARRLGERPRAAGALAYVRRMITPLDAPEPPMPAAAPPAPAPPRAAEWLDDDPAVVHRNLARGTPDLVEAALADLPALIGFEHAAVRQLALNTLLERGDALLLAGVLRLLDEPRRPELLETVELLTTRLDQDRLEATSRTLLRPADEPAPRALVWALERIGREYPLDDGLRLRLAQLATSGLDTVREAVAGALARSSNARGAQLALLEALRADPCGRVRAAALGALPPQTPLEHVAPEPDATPARALDAWHEALAPRVAAAPDGALREAWLVRLRASEAPRVRAALAAALREHERAPLAADPDPRVRAAALSAARAEQLWQAPHEDPSPLVREAAARLLRRRPNVTPPPRRSRVEAPEADPVPEPVAGVQRGGRLGISGHYGLPEAGFARAIEAGVELFIWEPNYATQTRFFRASPLRHEVTHLVGTFEAEPERVRRDVERALRLLDIERIGLFMVFWARSAQRLDLALTDALETLREQGRIERWGVSTHQRDLAVALIEQGAIDTLMVRHNAAHRGIEDTVLPVARAHGTPVITFSAMMYGRMLQRPGLPCPQPPSALDCYRYSLSQPGVGHVLSAPANQQQLEENLQALHAEPMTPSEQDEIRAFGEAAARESRAFARLIRWR